ncbi:hypothetical protein BDV12DRAFT_173226 [Aspergillus spectabilis]
MYLLALSKNPMFLRFVQHPPRFNWGWVIYLIKYHDNVAWEDAKRKLLDRLQKVFTEVERLDLDGPNSSPFHYMADGRLQDRAAAF